MRTLEWLLVLLCAAFSIRLAKVGRGAPGWGWVHGARMLLAASLAAQVLLEGWRWQMFPAYAATLVAIAVTPRLLAVSGQARFLSMTASAVLLAASVVSCLALPFVESTTPRGAFHVGVTTLPVAVSRPPDAQEDELKAAPFVRLWYPASGPEVGVVGGWQRFRAFAESRAAHWLRAVPTARAMPDAPVAGTAPSVAGAPAVGPSTRFPVLVYFDGWPEDTINNTNLIVELVSHGFAVASVQYPAQVPGMTVAAEGMLRAQLARQIVGYRSDTDFERSVRLNHARNRVHAQDAIAVLNALASLDADRSSRFANRLDTQRAGTFGFSFGGGIAAEASRLDPRIRAVFNMDGRHWGEALYKGVERPYMLITEELPMPTAADLASPIGMIRYEAKLDAIDFPNLEANLRAWGGIHIKVAGTAHMNFTDVPLRSPLRRLSEGGSIDARRAQRIIQTYAVEFFSRYLLATRSPALDSSWPRFPEAHLEVWPAPRQAGT